MNQILIDTHAHLYENTFDADRSDMINRALAAGVQKMIIQNVDEGTIDGMLALEKQFPGHCFPTIGLHPCSVNADYQKELKWIVDWLAKHKFVAIGESGLDYYWDTTFKEQQKEAFRFQIELAKKHNLPIVIHSRNAFADCLQLIAEAQDGTLKGVFHCFSDGLAEAQAVIEVGFYIGIGGTVTYKNSNLVNFLAEVDKTKIVVETDAPYLPPVPYRGKRNESSYMVKVVEKLAAIYDLSYEELAKITTQNAEKLFGLQ